MGRHQPKSVTNAVRVLGALVGLTGLVAVLTMVFKDDLVRSWAADNPDLSSSVEPPAFVPVAVVLFVVFAALAGVLVAFVRDGHHWARLSLTALVAFMGVATLASLRTSPPTLFLVLSGVSVLLDLALLACLWHPDTGAYIRGTWLVEHPEESGLPDSSSHPS
ncbi:MAG: hypothetical protein ACXVEC_00090 [Nocardioides sp.]